MAIETLPGVTRIENADVQLAVDFEIVFPDGIPGNLHDSDNKIILNGSVKLPEFKVSEHTIWYKGFPIPKIGFKDLTDKHFSITTLCDKRWDVYDAFMYWLQLGYDNNNSTRVPEMVRDCDIEIHIPPSKDIKYVSRFFGFRQDSASTLILRFNGCKIVGLSLNEFEYSSNGPSTLTATFQYFDFVVRGG